MHDNDSAPDETRREKNGKNARLSPQDQAHRVVRCEVSRQLRRPGGEEAQRRDHQQRLQRRTRGQAPDARHTTKRRRRLHERDARGSARDISVYAAKSTTTDVTQTSARADKTPTPTHATDYNKAANTFNNFGKNGKPGALNNQSMERGGGTTNDARRHETRIQRHSQPPQQRHDTTVHEASRQ